MTGTHCLRQLTGLANSMIRTNADAESDASGGPRHPIAAVPPMTEALSEVTVSVR